ncbi:MAG: 30S ribosomal protein S6e [archaeon]
MAEFKLVIGDKKTGKCLQVAVTGNNANALLGKKIGESIKGESFDMPGYEFEITGGADYCGFPMRKDLDGPVRKRIMITDGVGIRNERKGVRFRKTVCGNTVHEKITQVSMKVLKYGKKPLFEEVAVAPKEESNADEKKETVKKEKKEAPKKEEKMEPEAKIVKEEPKAEKLEDKK